jgi:hypothetical protein
MRPAELQDHLFALEERFWKEGADYYRRRLAPGAMMVFPEPAGVLLAEDIVAGVEKAPRWTQVELEEHRLLELDERAALVTYKAIARRPDGARYATRASSAYVSDGQAWRLAFHQQTPL